MIYPRTSPLLCIVSHSTEDIGRRPGIRVGREIRTVATILLVNSRTTAHIC